MKLLDRYLVRELLTPLLIGTVILALLFVANDMIAIYKNFNVDSIPFTAISQLLILKLPFWLNVTLPIGTTLGVSLAVSRMSRESEITALRASGVSLFRIFRPLLLAGILMTILNFFIIEKLVPPSSKSYRKLVNEVGLLAAIPEFRSNVSLTIGRYSASFGSIQRGKNGLVNLNEILLMERPFPGEDRIYKSSSGTYQGGVWIVKSPVVYRIKGLNLFAAETKDTLRIYEPIRITDLFAPPSPDEETVASLSDAISKNRKAKQATTKYEIALQQKFSVPSACMIFAFVSAVIAFRFSKSGPFIGVMLSMCMVWLYFNLYIISGEIFGKLGLLSPVVSAWLPNVLFAAFGMLFVRRLE